MLGRGFIITVLVSFAALPANAHYHSADINMDQQISVEEILRIIQFFNSNGFSCQAGTEDGYSPGSGDTTCMPHDSDFVPQDWRINLSELLRIIQFLNAGGYHTECGSEDGFGAGAGSLSDCGSEGEGEGTTWYVKSGGTGDGSSWSLAAGSIQTAVDAAFSAGGGAVWVAAGTYSSVGTEVVTMKPSVTLYGGFAGTESRLEQRDWQVNPAVIDGENVRRCVVGSNNGVLDGFTLQNGFLSSGDGAGMYNESVSPSVLNCHFLNNVTSGNGGGMFNGDSAAVAVSSCTFSGNMAHYGAGMCNLYGSAISVTNCTFEGNTATPDGHGGALYNRTSSPTVIRCTFVNNTSDHYAGGLQNDDGSTPEIMDCIFYGNSASYAGGGLFNSLSSPIAVNCIFLANSATRGAGIHNYNSSSPSVTNCSFSNNVADYGAGIDNKGPSCSPEIVNCILWDDSTGEIYNESSSFPSVSYSCIWGGYAGEGNISSDPFFLDGPNGDLRLTDASPCINRGTGEGAPGEDFLGMLRPQGDAYDMGAYEYAYKPSASFVASPVGGPVPLTVTFTDCSTSGSAAITGWLWDFGDGSTSTESNPTHIYTIAGSYAITLTVTTAIGSDAEKEEDLINVVPEITGVWYVKTGSAGDGSSWDSAFGSIQEAVAEASSGGGGMVWVATGSYTSAGTEVVAMAPSVTLYGGFTGTEYTLAQRDWKANPTVIDGQGVRRCVVGADDTTLDGFIVQNGYLSSGDGAGMYNESVSPSVLNCSFLNNVTSGNGGGMYNGDSAAVVVSSCTFSGNTAHYGAGMCNLYGSAISVTNCTFSENTATPDGHGGALYNRTSSPTVIRCTFVNNTSDHYAGGLQNDDGSTPLVKDSIFSGNTSAYSGGGLFDSLSSPTVINCVFFKNQTSRGAGIYNYNYSSPVVTNCTFANNVADYGGGIRNYGSSSPIVTNCILWNDSVEELSNESLSVPVIRYCCVEGGYTGVGNIGVDPLFLDPDRDDFRLNTGSPCIDSAMSDAAPSADILGADRPQGTGYDMGAYEYTAK